MAIVSKDSLSYLSLRYGFKCVPEPSVLVKDCLLTVGREIRASNITLVSQMNKANVMSLNDVSLAVDLIECNLIINNEFVQVMPLSNQIKKVVYYNVYPFIRN